MTSKRMGSTLVVLSLLVGAVFVAGGPAEAKKKKKKKPPACAVYEPGEEGAEAPLSLVTDAHTAEAPLEVTITQEIGLANDQVLGGEVYDGTSHAFANVQVDSAAAEAGLFIRYEFPDYEDHDLYVNFADGTEAAHVGGFNPVPQGPFDGTGTGGHSEQGAEQLDGLLTADCDGYTLDLVNFLGEGGEYTVKLWLGEAAPPPA